MRITMRERPPRKITLTERLRAIGYAYMYHGGPIWVLQNLSVGTGATYTWGPIVRKQNNGMSYAEEQESTGIHNTSYRLLWVCDPFEFPSQREFEDFVKAEYGSREKA
jgi:hypothetical protein